MMTNLVPNSGAIKSIPRNYESDAFEASSMHSGENVPLTDECPYDIHTLVLTRSAGFGFGFALSGGADEPPIENNGDRYVYVSDVLRSGPADGRLRLFDRIISVNGISLAGVDNATAVGILRDAGSVATIVVRRRQSVPAEARNTLNYPVIKNVSLSRKSKNLDFGLVLGIRLYVKGIIPNSPAALAKAPSRLQEGDIILKLNDISTEDLTLNEARKLLEKAKDRIDLTVLPLFSCLSSAGPTDASVDNTSNSNDGIQYDNNSIASWSLSSLNARSNHGNSNPGNGNGNGNGNCNSNVNNYNGNTLTGYRSSNNGYGDLEKTETDNISGLNRPIPEPEMSPCPENARMISFCKDGSVGIRLVGGNRSGIYIADVQSGSVAATAGLMSGDHILRVNDFDYRHLTREEAVMHLLQAGKVISMMVVHQTAVMKSLLGVCEGAVEGLGGIGGDSFYVRANFDYPAGASNEPGQLMFRHGDILHVTDTLYNGTIGCWFAARLSQNNMEVDRGIIPNLTRGEQMRLVQKRQILTPSSESSGHSSAFGTLDRASAKLFGRSKPRRAKSLSRDYWESMANGKQQPPSEEDAQTGNNAVTEKRPAYERVRLVDPGSDFRRPVVVYGAVGDLARHRLTTEFPAVFECPVGESQQVQPGTAAPNKVIRLRAIRQVMERGRHAVLDITPNSVDKLIDAGFHPIVIFVKSSADQRQFIKDAQQRLGWHSNKSTKKLLSEASRLEVAYSHLFSAVVTLTASDQWFVRLRQAIELSQNTAIWISDGSENVQQATDTNGNVSIPNISGNPYVMPNCNMSIGEGEEDDDEEMSGVNGGGWKQQHPFATIRHMRNSSRTASQKPMGNGLNRENVSTVSSSAIMSSIDTPGSYATLPSRRTLPPPPPPPTAPAAANFSKPQQPQQQSTTPRLPSEYANFATLRSPPSAAAVAVPSVVPLIQDSNNNNNSNDSGNQYDSAMMMASTTSTVIEHGVSLQSNMTQQHEHYRTLSNVVSMQAAALSSANNNNSQQQQQPQQPSQVPDSPVLNNLPQSQENRVYPSFYADEQLSNDQRQTINTYGTLSRPRSNHTKNSRSTLLAQTDFRSPIIEAKELEASGGNLNAATVTTAVEECLAPATINGNHKISIAVASAPTVTGSYAPLNIGNQNNGSLFAESRQSKPIEIQQPQQQQIVNNSPLAAELPSINGVNSQHYQTPPSPASSNRYASLHLVPRPYRKIPNQFQMLHGVGLEPLAAMSDHQNAEIQQQNTLISTPEKQDNARIASIQAAAAIRSQNSNQRSMWQHVERTPPQTQQQNQQLINKTQQQQQQQQQSSPAVAQPAVSSDPLVLDTIRASVDYAGGVLESKATGVSLHIPRGALPPVVRQEVYFRVCSEPGAIAALQQNGNTQQEHGVTPVVMCGPPGLVFRRQVELRLPRAVRLRLSSIPAQAPICYGPVDIEQIMSVFIDHF